MNKFILTLCFLVVTLLHILLIIYYRNDILFTTTQNKPSEEIVQIQLSKTIIEKEKIEEKKVLEEPKKTKEKNMKIGDKVQFQIGEEILQDVIVYVDNEVIEGEKFDLTHIKFTVIK